jgi:hypothetical protein
VQTTTQSPLTASIKRLAITKDQRRVLLALADAGDWTPMTAVTTLLGKTGLRRVVEAVSFLIGEHLVEGGSRNGEPDEIYLRARQVEEWDKDDHFLLGIAASL